MIGMHKVVISSPSALKHVLVTNVRNYPKGYRTQRVLSGILGSSLLTTHGEEHSRQRAYIAPAFHYVRMEKFHRVFAERTQKLCQVLHQNKAGSTVDITDAMTKLTLDIIGLTACGYDFNATGSDNQSAILSAYTTVFDSTGLSAVNFLFPWFEHVPTPFNLRLRAAKKMVRSKVAEVIEQKRRQEAEAAGEDDDNAQSFEATDLLGLLIKQMGADEHGNNLSTKELSSEELTAQVMTFLFAGHETTATTLCWALHLLSTHPDTQLRVQVELDEVLCGKPPTHDDMAKLPVLRATVDETLRLFSAAPITSRRALGDDVIDGFEIPAGVV
jgi:cytochrome P450